MKKIIFVVCLLSVQALKAIETNGSNNDDMNDVMLLKIISGLSNLKSSRCKSDLNITLSAFRERRPWAVASKKRFDSTKNM